jgi:hypothetical protein
MKKDSKVKAIGFIEIPKQQKKGSIIFSLKEYFELRQPLFDKVLPELKNWD